MGFFASMSGSFVRPKAPPASTRVKGIPSSSQAQSTFMTLLLFARP